VGHDDTRSNCDDRGFDYGSLRVNGDAEVGDVERRSASEGLRADLDSVQVEALGHSFVRDKVLEEEQDVLRERRDRRAARRRDEGVDLPVGVGPLPQVPRVAGNGNVTRKEGADGLDAAKTTEPDHDFIVGITGGGCSRGRGAEPHVVGNIGTKSAGLRGVAPVVRGLNAGDCGIQYTLLGGVESVGESFDIVLVVSPGVRGRPLNAVRAGADESRVLRPNSIGRTPLILTELIVARGRAGILSSKQRRPAFEGSGDRASGGSKNKGGDSEHDVCG